jgi:hypothetical protein
MPKKNRMVSLEETVTAETLRQISEINAYRRKGEKLNLSMVIERMLDIWNRHK